MPLSLGFSITTATDIRKDAFLFGESQSRVVVSVTADKEAALLNHLRNQNIIFTHLGNTTTGNIVIDGQNFGPTRSWASTYDHTLGELLEQ
jgi:phosphoribosylformylglycinamidine synthase subunit PurL